MYATSSTVTWLRTSHSAIAKSAIEPLKIAILTLRFLYMFYACTDKATSFDDPRADPRDTGPVALGAKLYTQDCSACHGAELEGQPNWRSRLPNGKLPAPPHDDSGHTWHHTDQLLFDITKHGLVWPYAPKDYQSDMPQSDMPAFDATLAGDEIWAVLAYIKSHW